MLLLPYHVHKGVNKTFFFVKSHPLSIFTKGRLSVRVRMISASPSPPTLSTFSFPLTPGKVNVQFTLAMKRSSPSTHKHKKERRIPKKEALVYLQLWMLHELLLLLCNYKAFFSTNFNISLLSSTVQLILLQLQQVWLCN